MESIKKTKILVGIAATPNTWLELTAVNQRHPLSRYFLSRVELGPLSKTELQETLIKSVYGTGVSFTPEIIELVFEHTEGHPYEMQVLCHHLFNNQLSRRVDLTVWEKALQAALNDLGVAVFDRWFSQASSEEAKVLYSVAHADSPLSAKEIQDLALTGHVKVSTGSISKYLQRLVEKKLIDKAGRGSYTVTDRMFRTYIRNRVERE